MNVVFNGFGLPDIIVIFLYIIGAYQLRDNTVIIGEARYEKLFSYCVIIHFIVTFLYPLVVSVSDSTGYFNEAVRMMTWKLDRQARLVVFATYPLVHIFHLSYIGCMYVFSFIGLLGWYYLLRIVYEIAAGKWHKWFYLMLMPQLHYWTCALGKDSLIFFAVCVIMYAWFFSKSFFYYIIPCFIIGNIRSPILMLMVIAYAMSFMLQSKASLFLKLTICIGLFAGTIAFMPMVEQRLGGTDITSASSLQNYIEAQVAYNQGGGSSVDLRNANIVVKIFSYIFRPLFFDARSILQLEASFENLIWLSMFIFIVRNFQWKYMLWFPTLAFILMWFAQGSVLNNLGIAMRQKMMFFPMFLLLFMQILYDTRKDTFETDE